MRPRPSRSVARTFVRRLTRKATATLRPERFTCSAVMRTVRAVVRELAPATVSCGGTAGGGRALGPLAAARDCAATPGPGVGATVWGAVPRGRLTRHTPRPWVAA